MNATVARAGLILWTLAAAVPAAAEWPYLTEEATNLAEGHYSVSLGVGWHERERNTRYPGGTLLDRPSGSYGSLPQVEGTLGIGSRSEVTAQYEYYLLDLDDGGSDAAAGDFRLWTKLGLLRGQQQDLSLRFGVKFPNANEAGTNETDAFATVLYGLSWGALRLTCNAGVAVLGNPAKDRTQDDMFTWAAALAWAAADGAHLGLETAGMNGPFGVDRARDHRTYAAVAGWGWGAWRLDAALRYGVHQEEGWGWLTGVSYTR